MKKLCIAVIAVAMTHALSAQTFTLKSNDLGGQFGNTHFGNSFGCTGEGKSPHLKWENAPKDTKAFAITMFDPDAPTGSGFWHWTVYNIPANVTELKTDAGNFSGKNLPEGALNGGNDAMAPGYIGPCPPPGPAHQYIITVYALKAPIQIDKGATAAYLGFMLNMNTLSKASIIAYGQR
jgi:hypothetical protein